MKILQVITSLQTGGAEKLIVDIVPRLRQLGHEVDVCLFNGMDTPLKKQLEACGCRIYCLSYNELYYHPFKAIKLWRVMRHYDIVHTHNSAPQFFAAIAEVLCSVVLVTTEHSTSNRRRDWRCYPRWIDRWMYNQYKKVICISQQAEENLRKFVGHTQADIMTIYNGVDVAVFHDARPNSSLRNGSHRFVIVMVAGFRYQKDQDTLIKAMAHLNPNEYELWLVGDGERKKKLEDLVELLGGQANVRFLGLRTDVAEILHTADVIVMSSHFEGFSLSNIEGMSVGKPFIACNVDGLREMTAGAGLLFEHQNDKELAVIIEQLHYDRQLYQQVADACYEKAKQFDISKMVEQYNKVYLSISR